MKKRNVAYLTGVGKLSFCLAIMLLFAGCSMQNSFSAKATAKSDTNQIVRTSSVYSGSNPGLCMVSVDALGMSIFTNRQETLAQRHNHQETQLAVLKPTIIY
jgi:hypothetical protein